MARAIDVAGYMAGRLGAVATMKLQKLVFYAHALSLVERGVPLVCERVEFWDAGPVFPALYWALLGACRARGIAAAADLQPLLVLALSEADRELAGRVLDALGGLSGAEATRLAWSEWPDLAPQGASPTRGERRGPSLSDEAISEAYSACGSANPLFRN